MSLGKMGEMGDSRDNEVRNEVSAWIWDQLPWWDTFEIVPGPRLRVES